MPFSIKIKMRYSALCQSNMSDGMLSLILLHVVLLSVVTLCVEAPDPGACTAELFKTVTNSAPL